VNGVVVERPQHMLMRVSVGIHKEARAAVCPGTRACDGAAKHTDCRKHEHMALAACLMAWHGWLHDVRWSDVSKLGRH